MTFRFAAFSLLSFMSLTCSSPPMRSVNDQYYFPAFGECGFTDKFHPPLAREIMGDSAHYHYHGGPWMRDAMNLGLDFAAPEGSEVRAGVTGCIVYYGADTAYGRLVAVVSVDTKTPVSILDGIGRRKDVSRFVVIFGNIRQTKSSDSDKGPSRSDTHLDVGTRVSPGTVIGWTEPGRRERDSSEYLFYAVRIQSWKEAWQVAYFSPTARYNESGALAGYYTNPADLFVRE